MKVVLHSKTKISLLLESSYESYSISVVNIILFAPEPAVVGYGYVTDMMLYLLMSHKEAYAAYFHHRSTDKIAELGEKAWT